MHFVFTLMIGLIIGALEGVMIFFVPEEPHKIGVVLGSSLKGLLTGLLISLSLGAMNLWAGIGFGLLYGFLLSFLIVLPEGGIYSKDAKYIIPFGTLGGALIGFFIVII